MANKNINSDQSKAKQDHHEMPFHLNLMTKMKVSGFPRGKGRHKLSFCKRPKIYLTWGSLRKRNKE